MMKRLISLAFIAVLVAMLLPAPADCETFPQPEGGRKFESDWAIAGGLAEIYYEEEGYRATLTIENRDGAGSMWEYACFYMEDTDSLLSFSSRRLDFTIDPDTGDTVYGDVAYEGIDEEGNPQINFRKKVTLDDVIGIIEDGEKVSSVELKRRLYE